jgi:hypothetical protein
LALGSSPAVAKLHRPQVITLASSRDFISLSFSFGACLWWGKAARMLLALLGGKMNTAKTALQTEV